MATLDLEFESIRCSGVGGGTQQLHDSITSDDSRPSVADLQAQLRAAQNSARVEFRKSMSGGRGRFYTDDAVRQRRELQEHPDIVSLLELLWFCANTDASDAIIDKGEYLVMHRKITLALSAADITPRGAAQQAEEDWERDSNGKDGLDRERFYWTWFELADMYTRSMEPEAYVNFLGTMLLNVVTLSRDGKPAWKRDREVSEAPTLTEPHRPIVPLG